MMQAHLITESKLSLPLPAAHQTTENITEKCVILKYYRGAHKLLWICSSPLSRYRYTEFILKC